jgi:hypothetical protein
MSYSFRLNYLGAKELGKGEAHSSVSFYVQIGRIKEVKGRKRRFLWT